MPYVEFPKVKEAQDFAPLPNGRYLCALAGVATMTADGREPLKTRAGDEMWDLRFRVEEGEYAGRNIYDRISFGPKALPRVKLLCSRLGLDVSQPLNVTPDLIRGRRCWVTVETETYVDNNQNEKERNSVPFAGFEAIEEGDDSPFAEDDDLPF